MPDFLSFQEQGQIYTHKLADTMPNITLQTTRYCLFRVLKM